MAEVPPFTGYSDSARQLLSELPTYDKDRFAALKKRWNAEVLENGDHRVDTHNSRMAFRFDEHGAPLLFRTRVGQGFLVGDPGLGHLGEDVVGRAVDDPHHARSIELHHAARVHPKRRGSEADAVGGAGHRQPS